MSNFNEIFSEDVTYDNIKSHKERGFHPLFRRHTAKNHRWGQIDPPVFLWVKQKNAEALAPGQTDEFISQVLNSSNQNSDQEEQVPRELTEHLCAFKQSDSFGKTVILSLIDHKKIHY